METMRQLYTPDRLERLRRQIRAMNALCFALGGMALAGCVVFCLLTRPDNASVMEFRAAALSTLGGWAVIAVRFNGLVPRRRLAAHMENMLSGPRETREAVLRLEPGTDSVPGSIDVRRLTVVKEGRPERLLIRADLAGELGDLPRRLRVETVHNYVVAVGEVI